MRRVGVLGGWLRGAGRKSALFLALLCLIPPPQADAAELPLASGYADETFHTVNVRQFAADVATATDGKLTFAVHSGGSLIKPGEIYAGVRDGKAAVGEVFLSSLASENPLFGIDALPFIVSGYDDAWRMWELSREGTARALEQQGLKLLYAVAWPPQNLYSRVPIGRLGDFEGLRMRTYNPASEEIAQAIKAKPTRLEAVDLKSAVAQGQFDLMITSSATGVDTAAWSFFRHYYKVSAWIPKNIVFMNKKAFDGLDAATQKALLAAAQEAETRGWRMSREEDAKNEALLAGNGLGGEVLDAFVLRNLDRIGEGLVRGWLTKAGPEDLPILLNYISERGTQ